MYSCYIDKILKSNDSAKMEQLKNIFEDTIDYMEDLDESEYDNIEKELYEIVYGKVLTEGKACEIIKCMKPYGMHWKLTDTESVRTTYGLLNIKPIDFWIVMNAMYNDISDTVNKYIPEDKQVEFYADISKDFIIDPDACPDKVYKYFTMIPKKHSY